MLIPRSSLTTATLQKSRNIRKIPHLSYPEKLELVCGTPPIPTPLPPRSLTCILSEPLPHTISDVPKQGKKVASPLLPQGLSGEAGAPPPGVRELGLSRRAASAGLGGRGSCGAWFAAFRALRSLARSAVPRAFRWTEKASGRSSKRGDRESKARGAPARAGPSPRPRRDSSG